jgi:hypothetical protein
MKPALRIFIGLFITASPAIWSTAADARRSDREGFNFGSSVRIMDSDDRGESSTITNKNTRTKSSGQAFSPYVGYAVGPLNLGLMLNVENKYEEFTETSPTSSQQLSRDATTSSKAISLFSRFNFGKIMFFEAGAGIYNQNSSIHTELRSVNGGSFTGSSDDYKIQGMGPGYHMGAGLELPAANGFYFTGSYMVHNYQLRDTSHSSYGSLIGSQQKRELAFGISYYN